MVEKAHASRFYSCVCTRILFLLLVTDYERLMLDTLRVSTAVSITSCYDAVCHTCNLSCRSLVSIEIEYLSFAIVIMERTMPYFDYLFLLSASEMLPYRAVSLSLLACFALHILAYSCPACINRRGIRSKSQPWSCCSSSYRSARTAS